MQKMKDFFQAQGVDVPQGAIYTRWFVENDLPLFVACTQCGKKMMLLKAYVDSEGNPYCADCAVPEPERQKRAKERARAADPEIEAALNCIFGD
ncbi:MAG: hypothetical protein U0M41_06500 [Negativibacillus sp.]|nr:hypothetical protein [Negativibacillus sp.]